MGVFTPEQVLHHLPRKYNSFIYSSPEELRRIPDKAKVVVRGYIVGRVQTLRFRGATSVTRFYFRDTFNNDHFVEAWNRPYLAKTLDDKTEYTLQGSYDHKKHGLNLIALKRGEIPPEEAIVPVYALPQEYPEHLFRSLVQKCLKEEEGKIKDIVPTPLQEKYRLVSHFDALKRCHFPSSLEDVRQGLRVLKYEEALCFSLKNQWIRLSNQTLVKQTRKPIDEAKAAAFMESLPYALTGDQKKAIGEILVDMKKPNLMYRLLQGDVGTGKTLVAMMAMYACASRSEQSALLAPTDALARQHYENLQTLFKNSGLTACLLVGNLTSSERKQALRAIASGEVDFIVGTHALFSKDVVYANLGLAVIDEQHKFGVNQRTLLAEKGEHADLLLMSATPIPRTLSMTLYGDMDVSILAEFPARQRNIITRITAPKKTATLKAVAKSIGENKRVYIVAPQIEENEDDKASSVLKVYESYALRFPGLVALLHGKMSPEEKEAAVDAFKRGGKPILVATSVIEVGIDVKAANLMIIYDPTHFALSSLHQLRGRIGRDGTSSLCLLVYGGSDEEDLDKLNVLCATEDGFQIAEEDLRRRGPGELAGIKQAGMPEFHFVNIIEDFKMFECARDDAAYILAHRSESAFASLLDKVESEAGGVAHLLA